MAESAYRLEDMQKSADSYFLKNEIAKSFRIQRLGDYFDGVADGTRTHDIQNHNLTL